MLFSDKVFFTFYMPTWLMKKNGTSPKTQIIFYHQSMRRINIYQYNAIHVGFVWHHILDKLLKIMPSLQSRSKGDMFFPMVNNLVWSCMPRWWVVHNIFQLQPFILNWNFFCTCDYALMLTLLQSSLQEYAINDRREDLNSMSLNCLWFDFSRS
jgi:hypothetical protein